MDSKRNRRISEIHTTQSRLAQSIYAERYNYRPCVLDLGLSIGWKATKSSRRRRWSRAASSEPFFLTASSLEQIAARMRQVALAGTRPNQQQADLRPESGPRSKGLSAEIVAKKICKSKVCTTFKTAPYLPHQFIPDRGGRHFYKYHFRPVSLPLRYGK